MLCDDGHEPMRLHLSLQLDSITAAIPAYRHQAADMRGPRLAGDPSREAIATVVDRYVRPWTRQGPIVFEQRHERGAFRQQLAQDLRLAGRAPEDDLSDLQADPRCSRIASTTRSTVSLFMPE